MDGRFTIVRWLGSGGWGTVYAARQHSVDREVAIKVLHPQRQADPMHRKRFLREARAASRLKHANTITVHDYGHTEDGDAYIVMELLEGRSLAEAIEESAPMSPERAVGIALKVCESLIEAHEAGVVHRDLKPDNVFLGVGDDIETVKVLDFGVASIREAQEEARLTQTGSAPGTPMYMSPEAAQGLGSDARTDLYSLGVILYEMLAGRAPFGEGTVVSVLLAHVQQEPPPLGESVPPEIAAVVARLLAKRPDDRPSSARVVRAELAAAIGSVVETADTMLAPTPFKTTPVEALPSTHRPAWRLPMLLAGLALAGLAVWKMTPTPPVPEAPPVAEPAPDPAPRPDPTPTPPPATPRVADRTGGVLRVAAVSEPGPFDPYGRVQTASALAMDLVAEPLVRRELDGEVRPHVVQRWLRRRGGKEIDLWLRQDLFFHPHPCLADRPTRADRDDLVYSLHLAAKHAPQGVDVVRTALTDRGAVRVTFRQPSVHWDVRLHAVRLLPAALSGCANPRDMKRPVGTGPFRVAEVSPSGRIRLGRFDRYWGRDEKGHRLPRLDGIDLRLLADASDAVGQLGRDAIDLVWLRPVEAETVVDDPTAAVPRFSEPFAGLKADVAVSTLEGLHTIFGIYVLRLRDGPLRSRALRRAIARAVDRKALVRHEAWLGEPATRLLRKGLIGWNLGHHVPALAYEPTAVVGDLAAAQMELGAPPEVVLAGTARYATAGKEILRQLTSFGLKARWVETDLADAGANPRHDAILATVGGWLRGTEAYGLFDLGGGAQRESLFDESLLELARAVETHEDRRERARAYAALEAAMLAELPFIPLGRWRRAQPAWLFVVSPRVRGFHDVQTRRVIGGVHPVFEEVWLE